MGVGETQLRNSTIVPMVPREAPNTAGKPVSEPLECEKPAQEEPPVQDDK